MTAVLTYDKIETNSYQNIFDIIDTRSNVADPRDPNNLKRRQFVYDYDPFEVGVDFGDLPYVIINMPLQEEIRSSLDVKRRGYLFRQRVIVRTARTGSGNTRTDVGKTDLLNISDDLVQTFNSKSIIEELHGYKISKPKLAKISTDNYTVNQKYVYENVYELSYETPFLVVRT